MGVWIDTDMGFDDIAAILVVAQSVLPIDGVSLVFGNAPLAQVEGNAAGAAGLFNWTFPIYSGRAAPVLGKMETAQAILGESGIPTIGQTLPTVAPLPRQPAFPALCHWLEEGSHRRILCLGPLTNIAALVLARPNLVAQIDDVTWMGGGVTSGNHTASAEFNALADPEALAIVLAAGARLRMVDLDLCRKVLAQPDDAERVRQAGGCNADLIADLFAGYIGIATSRGRSAMALYDPSAAVAFVAPETTRFQPARIDVELSGSLTRGRTVVETRAGRGSFNAEFAADIDAEIARKLIIGALFNEACKT